MKKRTFTESDVDDVMDDIVGAFQGEFGFPKLKVGAEALFRQGFRQSAQAALPFYGWADARQDLTHLPEYETWGEFVVELIRRVARSLKESGYDAGNKVSREVLRETILRIGADHGCPADPAAGTPAAAARWCSFFISPGPAPTATKRRGSASRNRRPASKGAALRGPGATNTDDTNDVEVQKIVFEMTMAFGSKIEPDLLSDEAMATFQGGFSRSVRDALGNGVKWHDPRSGKRSGTWREFVLRLVRKVGKKLKAGHTGKSPISAAALKAAVIQVGKKNGCPADGPAPVARWCSDFIKPAPLAAKSSRAKGKRRA